jgi:hypothetical protein
VSYTSTVHGQQMITGSYSGDAAHAQSSGVFVLNVRTPPKGHATLTFTGFNLDDFDNSVGQLQVLVNGQLVADIPAGLNQLSGSGDFNAYADTGVVFGPFDITALLVNGQNTVTFVNPLSSHEGSVRNVRIVSDTGILLNVRFDSEVSPGHSTTYTFSVPPLTITGLTFSTATPAANQGVVFTATFSGGTGPFTCFFSFGDGEHAVVAGSNGTCSTTHDYDSSGSFNASVIVRGASTSDRVSDHRSLTVIDSN